LSQNDLSDVLALVFDPIRGNMLTTRGILHGMGLRRIDGITSFNSLERRIKDLEISVVFLEASDDIAKMCRLVRSIRMGETKANPFLPIIATLWSGNSQSVAELMNVGCDDVLLRPFSVIKVKERIQAIIDNRKKFVVTSDYVGPDRGAPAIGHINVESFEVPNPLREMAIGRGSNLVDQNEQIETAKKRLNKERLAKLARRIAMAAEVTIQSKDENSNNGDFVIDLIETSSELVKTARRMGKDDIQDIAMVLENVVEKTAIGHERAENARLARQLALAIYVAYAVDDGEQFKKDLEQTLEIVRLRLDKAKERERRRRELARSIDASGFVDDHFAQSPSQTVFLETANDEYDDNRQKIVSKYNLMK
jgi:DNA-binding response OmpR family regulator